jgi:aspartate dehydrogenase
LKSVGIIGCGAIGTLIAQAVDRKIVACDKLILFDRDSAKAGRLAQSLQVPAVVVDALDELIQHKPSVVVESASQQAVRDYADKIISKDIDLIVMSVGGLLGLNLKSGKIHLPSGAIGGLDAISSAELAGIDEVILTTRKNPTTLDMDNNEEKLVYSGGPEEAVKRFPREMNVAATLALTIQSGKVRVRVISDPKVNRNVHEVQVRWKHGDMFLKFENDPHPQNPKTSALAAWSAIRLLKELLEKTM